jgi:putative FmdB family regulatory protein
VPTYDYHCENCKRTTEIFHSIHETKRKCPHCGASRLVKLIGPGSGFLFKGSGFYITDHRNSDYKSKAKAESESPKSSSSEGSSDTAAKKDKKDKKDSSHPASKSAST